MVLFRVTVLLTFLLSNYQVCAVTNDDSGYLKIDKTYLTLFLEGKPFRLFKVDSDYPVSDDNNLILEDLDFDGDIDAMVFVNETNTGQLYRLLRNTNKGFISFKPSELEEPSFDKKNKIISSQYRNGARYYFDEYKFDTENKNYLLKDRYITVADNIALRYVYNKKGVGTLCCITNENRNIVALDLVVSSPKAKMYLKRNALDKTTQYLVQGDKVKVLDVKETKEYVWVYVKYKKLTRWMLLQDFSNT